MSLAPGTKMLRVLEEGDECGLSTIEIGLPWSTHEFITESLKVEHPFDREATVPPAIGKAIYNQATLGPSAIDKKRKEVLAYYTALAADLQQQEEHLHARIPPDVESIIKDKKVLLFRRMLLDIHYDDMPVVHLIYTGIKLIGELDRTGIWKPDTTKGALISDRTLWSGAKSAQRSALHPQTPGSWTDLDQQVWEATLAEEGLRGPYSPKELTAKYGALWIPSRRFGITQGGKLRSIDDCSEPGINACFGSKEKVSMKGLDQVVAWSRAHVDSVGENRQVRVRTSSGKELVGVLHKEWDLGEWTKLHGRVADLKSAYKQLAVHPAHASLSIVAVRKPDGGVALFRALSLMFGEAAAVYAFLRISRALSALGTVLFDLILVEFFDDFTQIETERLGGSAQVAMEGMLTLLGWKIADSEAKRKPFADTFVCLGVQVNYTELWRGDILLENKPGRVSDIKAQVLELQAKGCLGFKDALSLRGRFAFAEGQTFCRLTAPVARELSCWASIRRPRPFTTTILECIWFAVGHLQNAGPRRVGPKRSDPPVLLFTDGAHEEDGTTIGGVIIVPGGPIQMFGAKMSESTVNSWKSRVDQKQVIGQAEIFPVLVAKLTWPTLLAGRRVISFIDNESARIALVRAYSPVLQSLRIIMQSLSWDYTHQTDMWYARVPTCCNLGDGPSRFVVDGAVADLGAVVVAPVFPSGAHPADILK